MVPLCCLYFVGVDVLVRVMNILGVFVADGLMMILVGDLVLVVVGNGELLGVVVGRVTLGVADGDLVDVRLGV